MFEHLRSFQYVAVKNTVISNLFFYVLMEYILFATPSKQNYALTLPVKLLLSKTSVTSMLFNTIVLSKMKISYDLSLYSFP